MIKYIFQICLEIEPNGHHRSQLFMLATLHNCLAIFAWNHYKL